MSKIFQCPVLPPSNFSGIKLHPQNSWLLLSQCDSRRWQPWRLSFLEVFKKDTSLFQDIVIVCAPAGGGKSSLIEHLCIDGFAEGLSSKLASISLSSKTPVLGARNFVADKIEVDEILHSEASTVILHLDMDGIVTKHLNVTPKPTIIPELLAFIKWAKNVTFIKINPSIFQLQLAAKSRFEHRRLGLEGAFADAMEDVTPDEFKSRNVRNMRKRKVQKFATELKYAGMQIDRIPGYGWQLRDAQKQLSVMRNLQNGVGRYSEIVITAHKYRDKPRFFDQSSS